MNRLFVLFAIVIIGSITACSSRSYPSSEPYPYPSYPSTGRNGKVIVTQDGTVIDRNGRVIGNTRNLPPGQAKKIFGTRSAKVFVPKHRKEYRHYSKRIKKQRRSGKERDRYYYNKY